MQRVATRTVTSRDGTTIAFERSGSGPAVILVAGALGKASDARGLANALVSDFTIFNYDRRGRGDSGDTKPYAVEREIEDIEALIDEAGGSASLYGISSGAVLALDAASRLPTKVSRVALYEPPFIVDDSRPPLPDDYVARLDAANATGYPGDAVEIFMTEAMGIPPEYLANMKSSPDWAHLEQVAETIPYDGRVMGDTMRGHPLPTNRWSRDTPKTLVVTGSKSEPMFASGARALVERLPDASHRVLEGQSHDVAPEALTPFLRDFFAAA